MHYSPRRPDPLPDPPRDGASDEVIDLGAILALLWRGKWLVLWAASLAAVAALVHVTALATPLYRASATLVLDTREERVANVDSVVGTLRADTTVINTEVEALRSRALFGAVVDSLNLVADPEFNVSLAMPGPVARLRAAVAGRLREMLGPAEPAVPATDAQLRERVISALSERVNVSNIPLSLVFEVAVETTAPGKSAVIANTIADHYIRDQIARKYATTEQATAWLAERVVQLQAAFTAADRQLRDFRATTEVGDEQQLALAEDQLAVLALRLADQQAATADAAGRLTLIRGAADIVALAEVAGDQRLRQMLAEGLTAAAEDRAALLLAAAEQDGVRAQAQLDTLAVSRAETRAEIARMSAALARAGQLTREAESARLIYENFLNRLQETSVQEGLQRADSRLLSAAVPPDRPSSPQTRRLLAIALVLGTLAGIGLAVLREIRVRGLRNVADLEQAAGLPVIGQIPLIRGRGVMGKIADLAQRPNSAAAEAVRSLRTSCLLAEADGARRPIKVIAVTSSLPDEGKTTLALALARSLAALGRDVVLVDGDLRRRSASLALRPAETRSPGPAAGLIAVLRGQTGAAASLGQMDGTNVRTLSSESVAPEATDLLAGPAFGGLMAALRAAHDIVIIDTPPILPVPDARLIVAEADLILFAVRWNRTTGRQLRDGLRLLTDPQRRATALVLTRIDIRKARALGDDSSPLMARYYAE